MALGVADQQLSRVSRQILWVCPEIAKLKNVSFNTIALLAITKICLKRTNSWSVRKGSALIFWLFFVKLVSVLWSSFTDSEGIQHGVEVSANTLYEAAALAITEFRRCGFTADAPGPATCRKVSVKAPATSH
jgi:hypothetical protein